MEDGIYWTIQQNWDGKLWPRLWPNERFAWAALMKETGMPRKQIEQQCDWSMVQVRLVLAAPNAKVSRGAEDMEESAAGATSARPLG